MKLINTLCLLALLLPPVAWAQTYSIDWFTIDGGGGTSTGGVYSVSGTIGQPDAGSASGGSYSLIGGFWSVVLVQQTGLPMLSIARAGTNVVISWPTSTDSYALQVSPSLSPASWTDAASGTNNPATVPATGQARFYRLHQQ